MIIINLDLNSDPIQAQVQNEFNQIIDLSMWDCKYQLIETGWDVTKYVAIGNDNEGNLYDATAIYSGGVLIELQNINKVDNPSMENLQDLDVRNIAEKGYSDNR